MAEAASALRDRLTRAALLDPEVYAEAGSDAAATGSALGVLFAVALAEGLGRMPCAGIAGLLGGVIDACLLWALALLAIHGAAVALGERSDLAALLRALAFAAVPFALGALDALPILGVLVVAGKWLLGIAAGVTAVARVLELDRSRAVLLCAIGLTAALLLSAPVRWLYSPA